MATLTLEIPDDLLAQLSNEAQYHRLPLNEWATARLDNDNNGQRSGLEMGNGNGHVQNLPLPNSGMSDPIIPAIDYSILSLIPKMPSDMTPEEREKDKRERQRKSDERWAEHCKRTDLYDIMSFAGMAAHDPIGEDASEYIKRLRSEWDG